MTALIFDLDGTLWDSRAVVAKSWNRAIDEHTALDIQIKGEDFTALFGKPLEVIFENIFPMLNIKERENLAKQCVINHNEDIKKGDCVLYEGMAEGIKTLSKKHKLFIVSNCLSGYIEGFLYATNLGDYFTDFTCPGDTGLSKADNIKLIMNRNGINRAVYIGDTDTDSKSAREAGLPFIFCRYGLGQTDDLDIAIDEFERLLEIDFDNM